MLETSTQPDYEALLANLRRAGTPGRVHCFELFWDPEIGQVIAERYDVMRGVDPDDRDYWRWHAIRMHRFLGYDCVPVELDPGQGSLSFGTEVVTRDTAERERQGGRRWADENGGPIGTMQDFEEFPWPEPSRAGTSSIEWFEKNVPDDMCLWADSHGVFEPVMEAMGYEALCYAVHDQPELLDALFQKVGELAYGWCEILVQFERIKILVGADDMGFKTGTMVSPQLLKEKALVWHRRMAELAHRHGKLYCLHACGNLEEIMETLIAEVKVDARHSFEDAVEPVTVAKRRWGHRIALLGGVDVDFLCRATPDEVRKRVREILDVCLPGGGYCLGTGNSVANYIPVDNYLTMLDEGRRYAT